MSLSKIILDKITNNRLSILLNNDKIIYLQTLLSNNPEVFNKISENIKIIAIGSNLDLYDMPQIILLISNLFNVNLIKHILVNIDAINIIQFIIDVLLESGLLFFPDLEL